MALQSLVSIKLDSICCLCYYWHMPIIKKEEDVPRPCRARIICCNPGSDYFKPRGIPMSKLEEVILNIDELEAIRLADLESLYQEDAAKKMNISRQTFGNIINSAHKKIADALLNAKALKIKGGKKDEDMYSNGKQ